MTLDQQPHAGGGAGVPAALRERWRRARESPPLMMLYPPVATGRAASAAPPRPEQLWQGVSGPATLYLHVPFCEERCTFCPFHATVLTGDAELDDYLDLLLLEAALVAPAVEGLAFTSVYLGGGTPSLLGPARIARLLEGLGEHLAVGGADVTLEAHPSTVDPAQVGAIRAAGVTRLSVGVQSFDPVVLAASGRSGTEKTIVPLLEAALAASFREVNVDLMYGLPRQTPQIWYRDLHTAIGLGVPALTLYATTYLPPFERACVSAGHPVAGPAQRRRMYELAFDELNAAGYPQPRFGAGAFLREGLNPHRGNIARNLPTLGLGSWAYSSNDAVAYHNHSPAVLWARGVATGRMPVRQLVEVAGDERARKHVIEALLLAFVDLQAFAAATGADLAELFGPELALLDELDLARVAEGELRLTREGGHHLRAIRYLFASDAVVAALESGRSSGL